MRVALLHNRKAGSESHAADELEDALRRIGHEVVAVAGELDELLRVIGERPCDLAVIAGGDGTVSRSACALAGRHVPLGILPLGTANNTALSLGVRGYVETLAAGWSRSVPYDYDLATIQLPDGKLLPFAEAVGWGVFPDLMLQTSELSPPDERAHTLERDRKLFRERIARAKPRAYEIEADAEIISGEFLFVEIVNIPLIGPQLQVSPQSDPSDGRFELVLAGESERTALIELAGGGSIGCDVRLPTRSVKHAVVRSSDEHFHLDGGLAELEERPSECSITVEPAAVQFLVEAGVPRLAASG